MALLDGYATGDGSPWQGRLEVDHRQSRPGARHRLLVQRAYGVVASVHEIHVPETTVIEGRTVRQRTQYQVVVPPTNRSAFIEAETGWKLVRSDRPGPGR